MTIQDKIRFIQKELETTTDYVTIVWLHAQLNALQGVL